MSSGNQSAEWMYEQSDEWWPFDSFPEWRDQVEAAFQEWLKGGENYTTSDEWVDDGKFLGTPGPDMRRVKWQACFGDSGHWQRRLEEDCQGTVRRFKSVWKRRIRRVPSVEDQRQPSIHPSSHLG